MSTIGVTSTGFVRPRLDELFTQLANRLKDPSVLGSEAVLDGTTADGQIVGIVSEIEDILLQVAEDSYNVVDPNNAMGAALTRLGTFTGISPNAGAYGKAYCLVHVREGETLPAGSKLRNKNTGVIYTTDAAVGPSDSDSHDYQVLATATKYDTLPALTTHTAEKVDDLYEWIDVIFYADGSAGTRPESPAKFRQRRTRSTAKASQGMLDSLYSVLADIDGVGDVKIFMNRGTSWKDIKPGDSAIPGHSAIVVVKNSVVTNGVDQVRQAIWVAGFPACQYYAAGDGANNDNVTDTQGNPHPIGYYVSTPYAADLEITYQPIAGEGFGGVDDENALKDALVEWVAANCMPGDDLRFMDLAPVAFGDVFVEGYQAPLGRSGGHAIEIKGIRVAAHGGTLAAQNLVVPFKQHVSLSRANITLVKG